MHDYRSNLRPANAESGNALWFILLAIALLVALTFAITRTSETTEQTGSRDRNRIQATDILRQAKSIEQAVDKMRIAGLSENDISFDNSFISGYANTRCTQGDKCKIFHASGGGLTYKVPDPAWLDTDESSETAPEYGYWYFYGTSCVPNIGTGESGCIASESATDLIVGLPWIREDLCVEINRLAGVDNLTGPVAPPVIAGAAYDDPPAKFTGDYTNEAEIDNAAHNFQRHQSGCFKGDSADPNQGFHFYHVLIAR